MKILIQSLLFIGVLVSFTSCKNQSCESFPVNFNSNKEALNKIKSTDFKLEDSVNTSRSSVIESAHYFSCDGSSGYLLIVIRNKEYIYQNVPISVWKQFKKADSFGSFYNTYIRGKYHLKVI